MKGFTLIELLVSVGIFTVVMVISLGALLSVAEADRKAQTLKTITNNLGFALDSMARTIRTGVDYSCGSWSAEVDCTGASGGALFTFTDISGVRTGFRFRNDSQCENDIGCLQRSTDGGSTWATITAPEVVVSDAKFYLAGSSRGDTLQPRVTITVLGYVQISATQQSEFRIQTSVTQRLYDQ